MEGTTDEAFHWKSRKGEGKMYGKVRRLEKILEASENPKRKLKDREGGQADLAKWTDGN